MKKEKIIYPGQEIFYNQAKNGEVESFKIIKVCPRWVYIEGGECYFKDSVEKETLLDHLKRGRVLDKRFYFTKEEAENNKVLQKKVKKLSLKIKNIELGKIPQGKIEAFLSFFEGIIE